jgi:hypothetical protein
MNTQILMATAYPKVISFLARRTDTGLSKGHKGFSCWSNKDDS